jgi:peptidoglycan/xylan/chitin deacetylase (PgdA/CDA1 family)
MITSRNTCAALLAALLVAGVAAAGPKSKAGEAPQPRLKVALTFDDLPLNGMLPAGKQRSDFARDTVAVLRKHRIPPSYGFVVAQQLEGDPDAALALRIWAEAGHPLASHTYNHLDLTKNSAEDFQREILRNEPVLELLMPPDGKLARAGYDWRWLRYPYLHEGDTLEKRRAVRAFLAANHYRIAQTTLDWEDYIWNSSHARCWLRQDTAAIQWLRDSYLAAARDFIRFQVRNSRVVFGRDVNHVMLLHLGSFSSHILPGLFELLEQENFEIVTLEEAQQDPIYDYDPDIGAPHGGTLIELGMEAKHVPWPEGAPKFDRQKLLTICQ